MVLGKKICGELKSLRRRIAEENGIPLRQEECTYTGECSGTCPHCEAEMRYLENAIADRLSIGKAATIAGLALGLATTVQAQAVDTVLVKPAAPSDSLHAVLATGTMKGTVRDSKTKELIPFAVVELQRDGKHVAGMQTDLDGNFTFKSLKAGEYTISVNYEGCKPVERIITVKPVGFTVAVIDLRADSSSINIGRPVIEIEGDFGESDGIMIGGIQQVDLPGLPASQSLPEGDVRRPFREVPIQPERPVQVKLK
jgi:hypothetical protein